MNNFETIIGIEIHLELNTKSKMFSSAPNDFNASPNTNVSLIDVGYPGTLPVVNQEAVVKGIKLAKALKMQIDQELHFDRKNYFYADLPKGFQITQHLRPIGKNGLIPIFDKQNVEIERIHLEEDTARSNHDQVFTRLDYNRAGTPLIEIVTYPVIKNSQEAVAYIDMIRKVARILDISDAKMEEGSLRADINLSLRPYGIEKLGTKVEIKNLNSLANVAKAIEEEINIQTDAYLSGKEVMQATKRFDEGTQKVIVMRQKTDQADYRYFAEPNIPVIALDKEFIKNITIPELPWAIKSRLIKLGIDQQYIDQLINDPQKLNFINLFPNQWVAKAIKLFFAELVPQFKNKQFRLTNWLANELITIIEYQEKGLISGAHIKKIIPLMLKNNANVQTIIKEHKLEQISDVAILEPMIDKILVDNQNFISANKNRQERILKFVLGQVMKASKGQANPLIATKLVQKKLGA